jgi:hypothetical protein
MNVINAANKHAGENANDAFMIEQGLTPQPSAGTTATASPSKSRVNNAGTVGVFDDGSFGPVLPNINLYSPVFNNTGDIARISEQANQLQRVAATSGGRY